MLDQVSIIIPTFNAEPYLGRLIPALGQQGIAPRQVFVIDSTSTDKTVEQFRNFGARVKIIPQSEFDHGATRRYAANACKDSAFLIFLTQDAVPTGAEAFSAILRPFGEPKVAMSYGRQIPRPNAAAIERHARLFNYPERSEIRDMSSSEDRGIKAIFSSNSFAAYRTDLLEAIGGFPNDCFFAEDQIVAGRFLIAGYRIAYSAEATVVHSHEYSLSQEFRRCFDIGAFHAYNPWILETFGKPEGEGFRFLRSELSYIWRSEMLSVPSALIRTVAKYIGYRIGRMERVLTTNQKKHLSMLPAYWRNRQRPR